MPLARLFALQQRGENAERAEQARAQVGDRNADAHGPLPRQAGDRHQPAHALRDLVEARPVAIGTVLAEAGDAGIDDALVDLFQQLVIDAETFLHVGTEILHHHVGLLHQAIEHLARRLVFQIERDRALVAMQILEIRAAPRAAHGLGALFFRCVDLDDIGAPVRQLPHGGGTGAHAGEIENRKAGKSLRGAGG